MPTTEATVLHRLIEQRKANGTTMTQVAMAKAMDIPLSTFAALLGGRSPPRNKTLEKCAAFFGVRPQVLRGEEAIPALIEHAQIATTPAKARTTKRGKHKRRAKRVAPTPASAPTNGEALVHTPLLDDLREYHKCFEHLCVGLTATPTVREYVALLARMLHEQAKALK